MTITFGTIFITTAAQSIVYSEIGITWSIKLGRQNASNQWNKESQKMYSSSKVSKKYWGGSCPPSSLPLVSYAYVF